MKKLTIIFGFLIIQISLNAQCWENVNTITTDWRNYPGKGGTNQSSNDFNWTAEEYSGFYLKKFFNINTQTVPAATFTLPMWAPNSSTAQNDNLIDFQSTLTSAQKDFHPEDGWELLIKNFGSCCNADNAVENPFYAIYNRRTGKIRAFMLISTKPTDLDKTSALMRMTWNPNSVRSTSIYQYLQPAAQSILNFNPNNEYNVPNFYVNEDYYWVFGEFIVAYDPCTCELSESSIIKFEVRIISESDISATINGTQTEQIVSSNSTGASTLHSTTSHWLIDNYNTTTKINAAGQKGFKKFQAYESDAINYLNNHTNEKFRDKYWKSFDEFNIVKTNSDFWDDIENPQDNVILGRSDFFKTSSGGPISKQDFLNKQTSAYKENKLLIGQEKINFVDRNYTILKNAASIIPYIGYAYSAYEFLVKGGMDDISTAPNTPTIFNTELSLSGTIKNSSAIGTFSVFNPGSVINGSNFIPVYNNILGVFNIFKIPKLEYARYNPAFVSPNGQTVSASTTLRNSLPQIRQFKLSEPLKFVINPNSGLDIVSIDAAFILKYNEDFKFETQGIKHYWGIHDQLPVSFTGIPTNSNDFGFIDSITSSGLELEYLSSDYQTLNNTNNGTVIFRTKYMPLECFHNQTFDLFDYQLYKNTNPSIPNKLPEVSVKLVVLLKSKTNVHQAPVLMILNYQVDMSDINQTYNQPELKYEFLVNDNNNDPSILPLIKPFRYKYNMPYFPSSLNAPDEIILDANSNLDRPIYAKNKITIKSGFVFPNNSRIVAGKEIEIDPDVELNPESTIEIGRHPMKCLDNISELLENKETIKNYCNSIEYKNITTIKPTIDNENRDTEPLVETTSNYFTRIYPNPTKADINIKFNKILQDSAIIRIYSTTGLLVYDSNLSYGKDSYNINLHNFQDGLYFLNIVVMGEIKIHKLIINKS